MTSDELIKVLKRYLRQSNRAAIKILNSQISRLPLNSLESAREQIEKRLGLDRLNRVVPFVQRNDTHDIYRL